MGYILFTSSGTFNPLSYGLTVGDTLNIVCVGGGGGGESWVNSSKVGNAGGTSSFGSILSARGGSGGRNGAIGSCRGTTESPTGAQTWGTFAPHGWMPGMNIAQSPTGPFKGYGPINGVGSGSTPNNPGSGVGSGYGAGGPGQGYNNLGSGQSGWAGEIKQASYRLTSTASIAVTVGVGGTGGSGDGSWRGGNGAPGCVAVFW